MDYMLSNDEPNDWHLDLWFDSPSPDAHLVSMPPLPEHEDLAVEGAHVWGQGGVGGKGRRTKAEKVGRIRTNRNSQKTYHNILKHWLVDNRLESMANKYNRYFNQRIYFVLALQEIVKTVNGLHFVRSYQQFADDLRKKKEREIRHIQSQMQNCEQIDHLRRLIQEIEFSVKACREFMEGNVYDAITTVFKRNQKKITKIKEFQGALNVFRAEAGYSPRNQ